MGYGLTSHSTPSGGLTSHFRQMQHQFSRPIGMQRMQVPFEEASCEGFVGAHHHSCVSQAQYNSEHVLPPSITLQVADPSLESQLVQSREHQSTA